MVITSLAPKGEGGLRLSSLRLDKKKVKITLLRRQLQFHLNCIAHYEGNCSYNYWNNCSIVIVAIIVFLIKLLAPLFIGIIILAIIVGVGWWIYSKIKSR